MQPVEGSSLRMLKHGVFITSRRSCPVCSTREVRYLHTMHFTLPDTSPLPAYYDVVVCIKCGSGFADSDAQADDYDKYYRSFSKYEDPNIATGGGCDLADRQRIEEQATFLLGYIPLNARIVDIGCGNGGLLSALKKIGFANLAGFDPSSVCVDHVRANGFNAFNISLPLKDYHYNESSYDLIVLSHVLEHIFDVSAVLVSLIPLLTVGGKLYIEVPDPARYDTNQFPPLYFFDSEHINHLGKESLLFLANNLNLSILRIGEKSIQLSNGVHYPAIFGLFQLGDINNDDRHIAGSLYSLLEKYIDVSLKSIKALRTQILMLVGNETPFVLWGAGSLAQRLISEPWFPLHLLQAVIDRDSKKHGLCFAGKTIVSPDEGLRNLPEKTIVICAAAIVAERIKQDYRALNLPYEFHSIV